MQMKMSVCPHCKRKGYLILHGYLYGFSESTMDSIKRGHRIFCSNRKNKSGCGKTFSILKSVFIQNFVICAKTLWDFLNSARYGIPLSKAFRSTGTNMSMTTCYRIFKKFRFNQPRIRTRLLNTKAPPDLTCVKNPLIQTIIHLEEVFPNSPVSDFQHHFQSSFL